MGGRVYRFKIIPKTIAIFAEIWSVCTAVAWLFTPHYRGKQIYG